MNNYLLLPLFFLVGCSSIQVVAVKPRINGCSEIQSVRSTGKTESKLRTNLKKEARKVGGTHLYIDPNQMLELGFAHGYKHTSYYVIGYGVAYKCESR